MKNEMLKNTICRCPIRSRLKWIDHTHTVQYHTDHTHTISHTVKWKLQYKCTLLCKSDNEFIEKLTFS